VEQKKKHSELKFHDDYNKIKEESKSVKEENKKLSCKIDTLEKIIVELKVKIAISFENDDKIDTSIINNSDYGLLCGWLGKKVYLKLLYRGSRDGFESQIFHSKCDNQGPTIVVLRTNYQKVIGGVSFLDWKSPPRTGLFCKDPSGKCFVFSLSLKKKYPLKEGELAICNNVNYGPIFGNYDLLIGTKCNKYLCGNFDIGSCYDYGGTKNDFYGNTPYFVEDYEVFSFS